MIEQYQRRRITFYQLADLMDLVFTEGSGPVKLLVTLGGTDPHNVTEQVMYALEQLSAFPFQAKVVVGKTNKQLETLSRLS